jgi:hypothetical protein
MSSFTLPRKSHCVYVVNLKNGIIHTFLAQGTEALRASNREWREVESGTKIRSHDFSVLHLCQT